MEEEPESPLIPHEPRTFSLSSEGDIANESGNYSVRSSPVSDVPFNFQTGSSVLSEPQRKRWDLNYHEAAIYLQEGENNDKFSAHPKSQDALPAYLITHNTGFYLLDLFASLLLMSLALLEPPSIANLQIHVGVHGSLELLGLLIIALELAMRLKWLGPKPFIKHPRTVIKTVTLLIMIAEAITVLIRQTNHFRVTRAIRPLFLLDSHYCRGVRRFLRQILQSLPPIFDMLILLLFFMLLFSILGFHFFSTIPDDPYFTSFYQSFISLFILLTTANYPDVMMPAYNHTRWAAIFFVTYLVIELYLLMNLFLAVVYDAFIKNEKDKLKKLLLHKRTAAQFAFKLLVSRQNPSKVSLRHFAGLMKYYKLKLSRRDVYLTFKNLNRSKAGVLSMEEFYFIYEASLLKWKRKRSDQRWSSNFFHPFDKIFKSFHQLVTWKWFDYFIYLVILANFVWILANTIQLSIAKTTHEGHTAWKRDETQLWWCSLLFIIVYIIECTLKILGLGPLAYYSSGWNIFDFTVTLLAVLGLLMELINNSFYYIVVLRPLRLLRLFKLKRRFRDILGTLFVLFNRMMSLATVMLIAYYFFAIIGLELFSKYDMANCCKNTSVEIYYQYDNITDTGGYYYLNNFENILMAGVTLFELTVVNNWYIIMEGYVSVSSEWSRLYFMVFYIVTMIVLTVVVAFILESFMFRIQYRRQMHGHDMEDDIMSRVDIPLVSDEVDMCQNKDIPLTSGYIRLQGTMVNPASSSSASLPDDSEDTSQPYTIFRGERMRSKDDFSLRMYREEVQDWILQEEQQRGRQRPSIAELVDIAGGEDDVPHSRTNTI